MLLCAVFGLVSIIPLRTIASCLPVLAFCSNKHFFKRTFDMWQKVWSTAYTRLKRLKWNQKKVEKKEDDEKQSDEDTKVHSDSSTATGEADVTGLSNGTATMQDQAAADGTGNDSDEVRAKQSLDSSGSSQPSAAQGSASSSGNTTGSSTATTGKGSPKPISAANKKELLKGATMRTSVRLFLKAHAQFHAMTIVLKCEDCKD